MALDPNIILQGKPLEVSSADERLMNALKLRSGNMDNQINQYKIDDYLANKKTVADRQNLLKTNPSMTSDEYIRQTGDFEGAKSINEMRKSNLDMQGSQYENAKKVTELTGQAFGAVKDLPDDQIHNGALSAIDALEQHGAYTPEYAAQARQHLDTMNPQQLRAFTTQGYNHALDVKTRFEAANPKAGGGQEYIYQNTPDGIVQLGKRDGFQPKIVINPNTGKPFIASSASPELQGNISYAKQNAGNMSDLNYKPQIRAAEANVDLATKPAIEAATATAKIQAENKTNSAIELPKVIDQSNNTIKLVDDLIAHKGLDTATGLSSEFDPRNYIAGTDATNFNIRLDQLKGQQFMEAYQSLKGGGQITELEGKKATDAISRMNTSGSKEEFVKAANEFKDVIKIGVNRAKIKAGANPAALASPQAAPQHKEGDTGRYNGRPVVYKNGKFVYK